MREDSKILKLPLANGCESEYLQDVVFEEAAAMILNDFIFSSQASPYLNRSENMSFIMRTYFVQMTFQLQFAEVHHK